MQPITISDSTGESFTLDLNVMEAVVTDDAEDFTLKERFDENTEEKLRELLRMMRESDDRKIDVKKFVSNNPRNVQILAMIMDQLPMKGYLKECTDIIASAKWKVIIEIDTEYLPKETIWLNKDSVMRICNSDSSKKRKESGAEMYKDGVYILKVTNCIRIMEGEGSKQSDGVYYVIKDEDNTIPKSIMDILSKQLNAAVQHNNTAKFDMLCHFIARNKTVLSDHYNPETMKDVFSTPRYAEQMIQTLIKPDMTWTSTTKYKKLHTMIVGSCTEVNGVVKLSLKRNPDEEVEDADADEEA
jgi:hypothetical protein